MGRTLSFPCKCKILLDCLLFENKEIEFGWSFQVKVKTKLLLTFPIYIPTRIDILLLQMSFYCRIPHTKKYINVKVNKSHISNHV